MKIAIHHTPGSFSDRWIAYCESNGIDYTKVNCYHTDIISQLADCDALMWHWHHADPKAVLFARQLIYSLEAMGKRVFPDARTCWHFDDKVGQKYLLEALGAPLVPSYVFYDPQEARQWAARTTFPKVFKLRGGAGSSNVILVKNARHAGRLINRAFGRGFPANSHANRIQDLWWRLRRDKSLQAFKDFCGGLARTIVPSRFEKMRGRERGYVYFQDFLPGNTYDTRVNVVDGKASAIRRYNREGDFRASGSGLFGYDKALCDERCLQIAFRLAEKMKTQSLALDFIFNEKKEPLIVEMSYGFTKVLDNCPGYWDRQLQWHASPYIPQYFMVEALVAAG
ncbi:ATP-grasp domain-containing protein [Chitinophaga vietnamensis]|uniref:ATP-grasp domain-containing protein n=1 Tax=Chitinophaga vietnamensis TaxID=2593957 RepID=UPI0011784452|nr:hypothetical protein [Chitinophaga vietnamensis]